MCDRAVEMTDVGATAAPTGPIARGSVARVGAATALAVACVYTVIYLAARDLPPACFSIFAVFWGALGIATGATHGLLQETTREVRWETRIVDAITPRTKAIVPVHYAGVACEMDAIMKIATHHNLAVVEDAAQGAMASYRGRALGSIGDLGALSFHETKNVISGEGGALLVNS